MSDKVTASIQVSTAQQFRVVAEARRAAQKKLESILTPETLAKIVEARQEKLLATMPRIAPITSPAFNHLQFALTQHNHAFQSLNLPITQLDHSITAWRKIFNSSLITGFQRSNLNAINLVINFEVDEITEMQADPPALLIEQALASSPYLTITVDRFGATYIGGQKLDKANAIGSRHGKLLQLFEANKDELLTKEDIRTGLQIIDARRVIKDLRKDLRQAGYDPVINSYPRVGFVYKGTITKN